jgi:hypothetical protein
MLNKILVFWGIAITAILVIENMIIGSFAFIFWMPSSTSTLCIVSTVVWFLIWYGVKWISWNYPDDINDDLNF